MKVFDPSDWIGVKIRQVSCDVPSFEALVGRESVVNDAFMDEKGQIHLRTEDDVWCPARLCSPV